MIVMRNKAKNSPKMTKKAIFLRTKFSTFLDFLKNAIRFERNFVQSVLHHIMVLCVQFHEIRMTGIRASQKEKSKPTPLPHLQLWSPLEFDKIVLEVFESIKCYRNIAVFRTNSF